MVRVKESGLVYRNPKSYLRAINAWHPSPVVMDNGELIVSFDLGQAVESLDYRTYMARSSDGGKMWTPPTRIFADPPGRPTIHTVRLGRTKDGTLVAMGALCYRDDPEEGLVNRANLGYSPMEVVVLTSKDRGHTWEGPRVVKPPLAGPAFETCHAVRELSDGRWVWPTSTWRGWNGEEPNGMKAVAFVSRDRGRTWPEFINIMDSYAKGLISWEVSLVELPDKRLLAVAWIVDAKTYTTQAVHYAVSRDGKTFGPPQDTGLAAETTKLLSLGDGRVLAMYRGTKPPGLWGAIAKLDGGKWVTLEQQPLWQGLASGMTGSGVASDELSNLKLGYPQPIRLPDGDVFATFWCCEDQVYNVRWVRLAVE